MSPARILITGLIVSLALGAGASARAASFDPAFRFRTLRTAHFSIHFHQGEEHLARRLAIVAEEVWQSAARTPGPSPPRQTDVVLFDQNDLANGFATPLPYNTIGIAAVWPSGAETIGRADDWLRLVFTHEFTHIVHLDRSVGWAKAVRWVFGRTPIAFPNLFLPQWQIEGLATWQESAATGEGRLHAGNFLSIIDEGARAGRFNPIDRVNGGLTDWPGDNAGYAYGLGFHAYLAETYGAESFARLAAATAGRVPFIASPVFARIYGRSLGALWQDYQASVASRLAASPAAGSVAAVAEPRRLTRHGFVVAGPRLDPAACARCVVYSVRNPHEFPALYQLDAETGAPRRLTTRYLGSTSAVSRDVVYFDQQERRRNTALTSDLYALDRKTGRVRRLSDEARLIDPDLSPDGRTLAAVQIHPGRRDLVLVTVAPGAPAAITTLASGPDTQFAAPRWSPDGRSIAAERHDLGSLSAIAVVDVGTRAVRPVASGPHTRFVTPAWRPDGRALVVAADPDEGPFNLYEIGVDESPAVVMRALTRRTGGATWPDVSADGRRIVFAGDTADGSDLFEVDYPAATTADAMVRLEPFSAGNVLTPETPDLRDVPYSPLGTLKPTSWAPLVSGDSDQLRIGLATGGTDVLGYHAYAASATWLAIAPAAAVRPDASVPDFDVSYAYQRWRPAFWVSGSMATWFSAGPVDALGQPTSATEREREVEAGVLFPIQHVRVAQRLVTSLARGVDELTGPHGVEERDRTAWRSGWSINTARRYGYSISPEDGVSIGVTAELSRAAQGASADAGAVTADGRVYLSPFARHQVLAARVAAGVSNGDEGLRRVFHLGGAQPNIETIDFGREAVSLLRGFGSDTFAGSRVGLINLDYRWPIARPQRGHGTWPLFLQTAHAAVFTDVGHAWTGSFHARDVKSSVGGELSADVVAGYAFPFTATVGAAWGHDGSGSVKGGGTIYVRLGRAF